MSEQTGASGGSGSGFEFLDRSRSSRRRRGKAANSKPGSITTETEELQTGNTHENPDVPFAEVPALSKNDNHDVPLDYKVGKASPESPAIPPANDTREEGAKPEAPFRVPQEPEPPAGDRDEDPGSSDAPEVVQAGLAEESVLGPPQASTVDTPDVETPTVVRRQADIESGTASPQSPTQALRSDPAKQQISAYVNRTTKVRFDMRRMQEALKGGQRQPEQAEIIERLMEFYATHGDPNALLGAQ